MNNSLQKYNISSNFTAENVIHILDVLEKNLANLKAADAKADLEGDTAFVIVCAALVFFMTPGLGYFYSGMARSKAALSLILICFLSMGVVLVQWTLFGASLAFSEYGNFFIGDFHYGGGTNVGTKDLSANASVGSVAFFLYQGMFATITPALIFGSVAERVKVLQALLFMLIWTTVVYDPLAYWTWAQNGWLNQLKSLDFAGGTPVHISSGFSGLAMALVLGKRLGFTKKSTDWKPHNVNSIFLGTAMLWFGWFGFNGGSALAASARAAMASAVSCIAAATGGLTWVLFDYRSEKKLSGLSFCCGSVAGLVGITPGSGFVAPWAAIIIGFLSSMTCNLGCRLKLRFGYDDALDVFGTHGLGGFFGNILAGVFAQKWVASLDGSEIDGGWVDGHWMQVPLQLAGSFAGAAWAFCWTLIILLILQRIPFLALRLGPDDEEIGMDVTEMGETTTVVVQPAVLQPRRPSDKPVQLNFKLEYQPSDTYEHAAQAILTERRIRKRIPRRVLNVKTGNLTWKHW